jgi:S-sulfo-L-cysteine synthase (3-phospho-L-serine-dependent)
MDQTLNHARSAGRPVVPGLVRRHLDRVVGSAVARSPLDLIGNTSVIRIEWPRDGSGRGFWAKLEGENPGGIKDRPALYMTRRARERGDLLPGGTIVESSSGTFALGLALAGVGLGHPVIIAHDIRIEPMILRLLEANGVRLELVEASHPTRGWAGARPDRAHALIESIPGAWWPDQYGNPDNSEAYAPLAEELLRQFDRIDTLVCSVGTGGHSSGIAKRLRRDWPSMRVVGVDAIGSVIFGQHSNRTQMNGLGNTGFVPKNVSFEIFDEVHWVGPAESVYVCRDLARTGYVSGGWSVGAVALVASWRSRVGSPDETIVAIFPDAQQRYWSTVYSDEFCREQGLLAGPPASEPDEIGHPMERDVTRWTRCTTVVDPRLVAR